MRNTTIGKSGHTGLLFITSIQTGVWIFTVDVSRAGGIPEITKALHLRARNMAIPLSSPIMDEVEAAGVEVRDRKGIRKVGGTQLRQLSNDVICAIAEKFGGEKITRLLEELTEASCVTNGGKVIADNRTRLAALTLLMAYLIGRPVERQEILTVNVDADAEAGLAERLKSSPALRQVFRRMIDQIEGENGAIEG